MPALHSATRLPSLQTPILTSIGRGGQPTLDCLRGVVVASSRSIESP